MHHSFVAVFLLLMTTSPLLGDTWVSLPKGSFIYKKPEQSRSQRLRLKKEQRGQIIQTEADGDWYRIRIEKSQRIFFVPASEWIPEDAPTPTKISSRIPRAIAMNLDFGFSSLGAFSFSDSNQLQSNFASATGFQSGVGIALVNARGEKSEIHSLLQYTHMRAEGAGAYQGSGSGSQIRTSQDFISGGLRYYYRTGPRWLIFGGLLLDKAFQTRLWVDSLEVMITNDDLAFYIRPQIGVQSLLYRTSAGSQLRLQLSLSQVINADRAIRMLSLDSQWLWGY